MLFWPPWKPVLLGEELGRVGVLGAGLGERGRSHPAVVMDVGGAIVLNRVRGVRHDVFGAPELDVHQRIHGGARAAHVIWRGNPLILVEFPRGTTAQRLVHGIPRRTKTRPRFVAVGIYRWTELLLPGQVLEGRSYVSAIPRADAQVHLEPRTVAPLKPEHAHGFVMHVEAVARTVCGRRAVVGIRVHAGLIRVADMTVEVVDGREAVPSTLECVDIRLTVRPRKRPAERVMGNCRWGAVQGAGKPDQSGHPRYPRGSEGHRIPRSVVCRAQEG
jgi:hypothetical protein